jgi:hypothetical protein
MNDSEKSQRLGALNPNTAHLLRFGIDQIGHQPDGVFWDVTERWFSAHDKKCVFFKGTRFHLKRRITFRGGNDADMMKPPLALKTSPDQSQSVSISASCSHLNFLSLAILARKSALVSI